MSKITVLSYTRHKRYFSPLIPAITVLKKKATLAKVLKERRLTQFVQLCGDLSNFYTGTAEWGLHFPEANGDNQSPINLNSREAVFDDTLNGHPLSVKYVPCRESEMLNTGNTVQISLRYKADTMSSLRDSKSDSVPRSYLVGGPFAEGAEYELAEFMFHWGKEDDRGSEHTVNFKAYPMELHLVHWNSKYGSLQEAMGKPDGIAIIALFIQVGREHSGLRIFTDYLEAVQYKGRSLTITTPFNPNCLLPDPQLRDFWTYQGSLTTPPCFENVTWILFRYPLTISHSQMEEFRRLKNHLKGEAPARGDEGFLVDNFRPTQPLNDRVVRASFQ